LQFQTGIFEVYNACTYGAAKRLRLLHKARAAQDAYGASDQRKKKRQKEVLPGTRKIRKKKRKADADKAAGRVSRPYDDE